MTITIDSAPYEGGSVDGTVIKPSRIVMDGGSFAEPAIDLSDGNDDHGFYASASSLSFKAAGAQTAAFSAGRADFEKPVHLKDNLWKQPESIKTANYTIDNSDTVIEFDDEGGAALTATLPASPTNGQSHEVYNAGSSALSIARNGNTIDGSASDDSIAADDAAEYRFIPGDGWRRIG